jgi:ribosome-binding protein aMBF1 (putative translation factor)
MTPRPGGILDLAPIATVATRAFRLKMRGVQEAQVKAEYKRMVKSVPQLPAANAVGNRPAVAFAEASIARNIVRDRERVGMTQKELADASGIRVEVLNRAERGVSVPSVRTLVKIESALMKAGLKRKG